MDGSIDDRIFGEMRHERDRNDAPAGFPALPEIPGGRYTRQDFFDLEVEHVFRKSWVMAGLAEEIPTPGSYKRFNKLMGAPILIVRDRDHRDPRLLQHLPPPRGAGGEGRGRALQRP